MTSNTAIPRDDANKLALLQHLDLNLSSYSTVLEISAADLAQLKIGLEGFDYSLKAQDAANNYNNALFALNAPYVMDLVTPMLYRHLHPYSLLRPPVSFTLTFLVL